MELRADGLVKQYGPYSALDGLDLRLADGEKVGLLGPNGSGKTTLLDVLAGLVTPTAGTVFVDGRPAADDPAHLRRNLGYVAHETMLYDELTARENLGLHAGFLGQSADRVEAVLDLVDLSNRGNSSPRSFSHGMKKRLSFARAELGSPPTFLLDEPFSGLDQDSQATVIDLLEDRSVLLVTHDFAHARTICDRVVVLQAGRVAETAQTASFESRQDLRQWYQDVLEAS